MNNTNREKGIESLNLNKSAKIFEEYGKNGNKIQRSNFWILPTSVRNQTSGQT